MFDADGDADEVFGDADRGADILGHGDVGHRAGVLNERLDAPDGDADD